MTVSLLSDELLQQGFRYALSLTHDESMAEDLVQDACVAILSGGRTSDRAYFIVTIRNRFIDGYRRRKKFPHTSFERTNDEGEEIGEIGSPDMLDWEAPDVLENGALERALEQLRPEYREVMFLTAVEGYTAQEIADLTGRPRGTVLSMAFRAKRQLRDILEDVVEREG